MRDITPDDLEMVQLQEQVTIMQWLVDNNIIRPAMDKRDGWVALNCYTAQPFTFNQLGEPNGNN